MSALCSITRLKQFETGSAKNTIVISLLVEHINLVFRLWWRPADAMGAILDRGSLLAATIAALATGFALICVFTRRCRHRAASCRWQADLFSPVLLPVLPTWSLL
jgi:hypothetical protein